MSTSASAKVRSARRVPRPWHWLALAELAGVDLGPNAMSLGS